MQIVFSLKERRGRQWCVCRGSVTLFSQLRLGPAIKLAREIARDEHLRTGRTITVEFSGPSSMVVLANYNTVSVAA